ncbi:serine hydrolase [Verrucomicrobiaceae bacterium 227]
MKLTHHSRLQGPFALLSLGLIGWTLNSCAPILDPNHPDQAPDINYALTESKDAQFVGSIPAIDQIVEAKIGGAGDPIFGGAIAVICNGQIAYMKGYGTAVYDPDGSAPFTKNTAAGIGSISKVLTAMATMKLVEMGDVDLDVAITAYFDHAAPAGWNTVTVRDLLSHRAGFERDPDSGLPGSLSAAQVDAEFGQEKASQHPRFAIWEFLSTEKGSPNPAYLAEPGLAYSNLGYTILGAIIDNVTRRQNFTGERGYERFVWSLLAGADDAALTAVLNHPWRVHDIPRLSRSYHAGFIPSFNPTWSGWQGPAGGWSMTIGDLARVAIALNENQILTSGSLAAMRSNQGDQYGLGLQLNSRAGRVAYGHDGSIDGFRSRMTIWPNEDVAVVAFGNTDANGIGAIVENIGDWWINAKENGTLPGVRLSELDRKTMQTDLYRTSREHGEKIEQLIKATVRENGPDRAVALLREDLKKQDRGGDLIKNLDASLPDLDIAAKDFLSLLEDGNHVGPYRPSQKESNLSPEKKGRWAYGANTGWLNGIWDDSGHKGVHVSHYHLGGFAWSGNFGWLDLGNCEPKSGVHYSNQDNDFGVNLEMASGKLSGYAYGGNIGWVKFEPKGNPRLDLTTGCMSGYAWSNNTGWINLAPREGSIGWKMKHFAPMPDEDNDALPDPWELEQSGNLATLSGHKDSDGDGGNDYFEYLSGSDPNDPNSILALNLKPNGSGIDLSWPSQPDRLFTLFSSEDLRNWNPVPEVEEMPGGAGETTIEISPTEGTPRLFWKIKPSLPMER